MIRTVSSLYDTKGKFYGAPNFTENRDITVRVITEYINQPNGTDVPQKHPKDFILYELGTWDDKTGQFVSHPEPIQLGHLTDFKEKQ